jgi:asparaginyl-tRNA synthetase
MTDSKSLLHVATATVPMSFSELLKKSFEDFTEPVTVLGWARSVRKLRRGELLFLQLYDGTCKKDLQVIVEKGSIPEATFEHVSRGKTRWCFRVNGTVKESPGSEQPWEIVATDVQVVGEADEDYPLQKRGKKKKGVTMEKQREIPHLRVHNYIFGSIARLRHTLAMSVHDYFHGLGCYWVATPVITFSDCEGAGEAFVVTTEQEITERMERKERVGGLKSSLKIASQPTVKTGDGLLEKWKSELQKAESSPLKDTFFRETAYLTVSGQLEGEAYAMGMKKIYTFGPTFRAEESHTTRHLPEFWMIEPEIVGIDLDQLMSLGEQFVKYCIQRALESCPDELLLFSESFNRMSVDKLTSCVQSPFVRLSYTDAIDRLQKEITEGKVKFEEYPEWGIDLGSEHEKYLTDTVYKSPVILHSYPAKIKSFYMKKTPGCTPDRQTVQACDWLVPGVGELIGGSIREEDYDTLVKVMTQRGMDLSAYREYLDLRRYGTAPHGGFGLGFERLVSFVGGIHNVRDCIPFPRWPGFGSKPVVPAPVGHVE